jgi:hypothetical protein
MEMIRMNSLLKESGKPDGIYWNCVPHFDVSLSNPAHPEKLSVRN